PTHPNFAFIEKRLPLSNTSPPTPVSSSTSSPSPPPLPKLVKFFPFCTPQVSSVPASTPVVCSSSPPTRTNATPSSIWAALSTLTLTTHVVSPSQDMLLMLSESNVEGVYMRWKWPLLPLQSDQDETLFHPPFYPRFQSKTPPRHHYHDHPPHLLLPPSRQHPSQSPSQEHHPQQITPHQPPPNLFSRHTHPHLPKSNLNPSSPPLLKPSVVAPPPYLPSTPSCLPVHRQQHWVESPCRAQGRLGRPHRRPGPRLWRNRRRKASMWFVGDGF
ncbi:hypothetical protein BC829DRAFT_385785, partial [Chytridium lagenaria]